MCHRLPHTTQLAPERPMFINSFGHIHSGFFSLSFVIVALVVSCSMVQSVASSHTGLSDKSSVG